MHTFVQDLRHCRVYNVDSYGIGAVWARCPYFCYYSCRFQLKLNPVSLKGEFNLEKYMAYNEDLCVIKSYILHESDN